MVTSTPCLCGSSHISSSHSGPRHTHSHTHGHAHEKKSIAVPTTNIILIRPGRYQPNSCSVSVGAQTAPHPRRAADASCSRRALGVPPARPWSPWDEEGASRATGGPGVGGLQPGIGELRTVGEATDCGAAIEPAYPCRLRVLSMAPDVRVPLDTPPLLYAAVMLNQFRSYISKLSR